jgi:hypothetical protein
MSAFMYAVICNDCGLVELNEAEYERQLNDPDARWHCPMCDAIAKWDDNCLCMKEEDA